MSGFIVYSEVSASESSSSLDSIIKAEDSAHTSGDKGVMSLGVINTTGSTFGTDLDYAPLRLSRSGNLYIHAGTLIYSDIIVDDNYEAFERRASYDNTTGGVTISYKKVDGTAGSPVGTALFPAELLMTFMDDIWSKLMNAGTEEAIAIGNFSRIAIGGKTVTAATYVPAFGNDESMMLAFDATNGRALIQDDRLEAPVAQIEGLESTTTSFVSSAAIDLRTFAAISIIPNVTTAGGATADYKIQWSFDSVNWFDETVDTPGTPSANESIITQSSMIRRFDSSGLGIKTICGVMLDKKARYVRIAQRSDSSVSVITDYLYQLLK